MKSFTALILITMMCAAGAQAGWQDQVGSSVPDSAGTPADSTGRIIPTVQPTQPAGPGAPEPGIGENLLENAKEAMYKEQMQKGEDLLREQKLLQAEAAFQKALTYKPNDPNAQSALMRVRGAVEGQKGKIKLTVKPGEAVARISWASKNYRDTVQSDGVLVIPDVPLKEPVTIEIEKKGFKTAKLEGVILEAGMTDVSKEVTLDPALSTLHVLSNAPQAKVEVRTDLGSFSVDTDPDGSVKVPNIPVAVPLALSISKAGFQTYMTTLTIPESYGDQVYALEPVTLAGIGPSPSQSGTGVATGSMTIPENKDPNTAIKVSLTTNRTSAKPGDEIVVYFQSDKDAYVTILDLGSSGANIQLWPNEHTGADNQVKAGQRYEFPGQGATWKFKAGLPAGTDKIVAYATSEPNKILNPNELLSIKGTKLKKITLKSKDLFARMRNQVIGGTPSADTQTAPAPQISEPNTAGGKLWGTSQVDISISEK